MCSRFVNKYSRSFDLIWNSVHSSAKFKHDFSHKKSCSFWNYNLWFIQFRNPLWLKAMAIPKKSEVIVRVRWIGLVVCLAGGRQTTRFEFLENLETLYQRSTIWDYRFLILDLGIDPFTTDELFRFFLNIILSKKKVVIIGNLHIMPISSSSHL